MKSKNTGNYRIFRQQNGIGGTKAILSKQQSEQECKSAFNNLNRESGWEYYCEQEVIYMGSLKDENGNPIDSVPTWIPMNV